MALNVTSSAVAATKADPRAFLNSMLISRHSVYGGGATTKCNIKIKLKQILSFIIKYNIYLNIK
jgi:hypothetical protein